MMDSRIFGVDIASGSPRSRSQPSYALFVIDGESSYCYEMVSRQKLIRIVREKRPDIIAVDNIYELAADRNELTALMRLFPPNTRIVQVTGGDHPEPLVKVARWHGIVFDRLNPMHEAEACARLAAKGIGCAVSVFEDRTWIKVSRRRSPGRGGWSQNRYSRKIHGNVKLLSREIEHHLKESGLEFTMKAVEGLGGYIRCEFVVEAPRERVPVHTSSRGDVQIRVAPIPRQHLQFVPLQQRRDYIIVGIDPGTTTGLAALNLKGELVDIVSARTMSSSDVIEWIAARGRPLIVATDVSPAPGAVEKIKRAFNAVLFSPSEDLAAEDKILLARPFNYRNDHERDALAAAMSAFKKYRNKFSQVEKKISRDVNPDEVKALVVRGYSIEKAMAELLESDEAPVQPSGEPPQIPQPKPEELRLLTEQVKNLREYVEDLRAEISSKDKEISELKRQLEKMQDRDYRDMKRDHEIRIRDKEIERLRNLLRAERKRLRRLRSEAQKIRKAERIEEMAGYRKLKPVPVFSKEAILSARSRWSIGEGDLILLQDPSGGGPNTADLIADLGVEAVVVMKEMPQRMREYFMEKSVPVLSADDVSVRTIDGISFVDPEMLKAAKERWEEQRKAYEAEKRAERLRSIIEEYRAERLREERLEAKRRSQPL
ncbi:MAG: DUF460 domain-containing protein [Methanothrix sp.]|uniref:DUF460 domain-containing protein n=1 Tax=Methanothrix sp. TaxID=90426 RepID=UPI0031690C4F|nr:DUF460 domain-containing protein [Methanothrix sp.]